MQPLIRVVAEEGPSAGVLAPHPSTQTIANPILHLAKHSCAVPIMKVSAPAAKHCVGLAHHTGDRPPFGVVIEDFA